LGVCIYGIRSGVGQVTFVCYATIVVYVCLRHSFGVFMRFELVSFAWRVRRVLLYNMNVCLHVSHLISDQQFIPHVPSLFDATVYFNSSVIWYLQYY